MEFYRREIGVIKFVLKSFKDDRGKFFESFNQKVFDEATEKNYRFVQDNQSHSRKGVVRGLHFQKDPHAQGKLVRCTQGLANVAVVDIRLGSPTFGETYSELLHTPTHSLWIPPGFAHGFCSLQDDTIYQYKVTEFYHPESEMTLMHNDPEIKVNWGLPEDELIISEKDQKGIYIKDLRGKRQIL